MFVCEIPGGLQYVPLFSKPLKSLEYVLKVAAIQRKEKGGSKESR